MRLPLIALVTAVLSLALAGTASANQPLPNPADFSFIATIDCGAGPVQVGSTDDIYAPLVDLATGREYEPVAWSVQVGDNLFEDVLPGASMRNTMKCSYDDGVAVGTVTVKRQCRGHHDGRVGSWRPASRPPPRNLAPRPPQRHSSGAHACGASREACRPEAAKEGQHSQDPPVVVVGVGDPELGEQRADVLLDHAGRDGRRLRDQLAPAPRGEPARALSSRDAVERRPGGDTSSRSITRSLSR